jgi:hypothetical protein
MLINKLFVLCLHCRQELTFRPNGWVHVQGYRMRCPCGWGGDPYPAPTHCPKCGKGLQDWHAASPIGTFWPRLRKSGG